MRRLTHMLVAGLVLSCAVFAAPAQGLNQADLEEILGPIALYPDTLLANVLAASMYPDELVAANSYIDRGGDPARLVEQGWEASVVAVARIPDLLDMMTSSLDWTKALGQAYVLQAQDVMTAVQSLRGKAKANGALVSNSYQTVVQDGSTIIIQPAQPQTIYVPQYDPQVVYVNSGPSAGQVIGTTMLFFGTALLMEEIFDDDIDCYWGGGYIGWGHPPYYPGPWYGPGYGGYYGGHHGGHNDIDIDIDNDININVDNDTINNINVGGSRGREGSAFKPNPAKVDTAKMKTEANTNLKKFEGASKGTATAKAAVPKTSTARPIPSSPKPAATKPAAKPTAPAAAKPAPAAKPATTTKPKPSAKPPTSAATRVPSPAPKPATPKPATAGKTARPSPGGFAPSAGASSAASRGATSRSAATAGGASRSKASAGAARGGR